MDGSHVDPRDRRTGNRERALGDKGEQDAPGPRSVRAVTPDATVTARPSGKGVEPAVRPMQRKEVKMMRLLGGFRIERVITWILPLLLAAILGLGQGAVVVEVVPGASIQAAIDAAPEGATVLVRSGLYEENLLVSKGVTLVSEEGAVIDAGGGEAAVAIRADNVTLRGFRIQDARVGVLVDGASGARVEGNTITANTEAGVCLRRSSGSQVYGNQLHENATDGSLRRTGYGIWLDSAHGNRIEWNLVALNGRAGICLRESHRNIISRNTLWDNAREWGDNVDVGCLIDAGGIVLVRSDENLLEQNTVAGNSPYGIELLWSSSNRVAGNHVEPGLRAADSSELLAGIAAQGRGDYCWRAPDATGNAIVGNVVRGHVVGVWLINTWGNVIQTNTCSDNRVGAIVSWWFGTPPDEGYGSIAPNRVEHNTFTENEFGIGIMDGEGLAVPHGVKIERNNIARNREAGLGWIGWRPEDAKVSARWNWWGDTSGPHHPELNPQGKGNPVTDGVEFCPWLEASGHLTPEERLEVQALAFYACTGLAALSGGRYVAVAT